MLEKQMKIVRWLVMPDRLPLHGRIVEEHIGESHRSVKGRRGLVACAWKGIAKGISIEGILQTFLRGYVISN